MIGIYAIICNGKYYIGQSIDIKHRWRKHKEELKMGIHHNTHLQNAYNKYGEVKFEVLLECEKGKLDEYEQYYIFELMTYDRKIGFNKNYGGGTARLADSYQGISHPVLQFDKTGEFIAEYKSFAEAERKIGVKANLISECCKKVNASSGGYVWVRKDLYESNPNLSEIMGWKTVLQFDLNGNLIREYCNEEKALKETNVNKKTLKATLNGKQQSGGGYIWRYKEDYIKNPVVKIEKKKPITTKPQGKPIVQLDLEGNFIAEYPNIREAKDKFGGAIGECAKGKVKEASNYRWVYKHEYIKNPEGYKVSLKKVIQLTEYGEFVNKYNSLNEATKKTGIKNINSCLGGKRRIVGGYRWMYEDDYLNNNTDKYKVKEERPVVQLDLNGNFIAEYHSKREALKETGIKAINDCLRKSKEECRYTAGGYLWIYKDEYDKNIQYKQKERKIEHRKGKTIIQLDLRGNQIGVYDSLIEAEKSTGIKRDGISRCLRGIQEITKECKWKYANDKDNKKKNKK